MKHSPDSFICHIMSLIGGLIDVACTSATIALIFTCAIPTHTAQHWLMSLAHPASLTLTIKILITIYSLYVLTLILHKHNIT